MRRVVHPIALRRAERASGTLRARSAVRPAAAIARGGRPLGARPLERVCERGRRGLEIELTPQHLVAALAA